MIRPKQFPTDLNLNSIKLNRPLTSKDMNLYKRKVPNGSMLTKQTLVKIQRNFETKIAEEQSAFRNYADSSSITDIRPRGIKGISYKRYQEL